MKITITMDEAIEFIKQALDLPYNYELEIDKIQLNQEPVKDIDWVLVERERVLRELGKVQQAYKGEGKLWCAEDMKSELIESLIKVYDDVPWLLDHPAYMWQGTKYQEEHDEKVSQEKAKAAQAEKDRKDAIKKKLEEESAASTRKIFEIESSQRYNMLKEKYGKRSGYYEDWCKWDDEEAELEKKKRLEAEDIKFYEEAGIPLPFTPMYQGTNGLFKIDGLTDAEFEAQQQIKEEENREVQALMDKYPDLTASLAGKPVAEIIDALRKRDAEPKTSLFDVKPSEPSVGLGLNLPKVGSQAFDLPAVTKEENVKEQADEEEEDPICIPTGTSSSPFSGFAPITQPEEQANETVDSNTAVESETPIELKEDIPVFLVDDNCPWADDQPVLV